MIRPTPEKKKSTFRKCIEILMASWNSILYWMMFKNYKCCGVKGCDCNKKNKI